MDDPERVGCRAPGGAVRSTVCNAFYRGGAYQSQGTCGGGIAAAETWCRESAPMLDLCVFWEVSFAGLTMIKGGLLHLL